MTNSDNFYRLASYEIKCFYKFYKIANFELFLTVFYNCS